MDRPAARSLNVGVPIAATLTDVPDRWRRNVERGFAVCSLLLLPGSEVIWQGIILAVYAATLAVLVLNWRSVWVLLRRTWPVLLPVLLAACSVFWSVDPRLSGYRVIALTGTTAFGMFLAVRFNLKDQLCLLALVLGVVACASALVALFLPAYGVMTDPYHEGAWSGIFFHKNTFGRMMALATLVFFLLALSHKQLRAAALLGTALCASLVLLSLSQASLLVAIACVAAVVALSAMQRVARPRRLALVLIGGILAASTVVWAIQHGEGILALLDRDSTFTDRTTLWAALLKVARLHPWFGYGYGAFWSGDTGMSDEVSRAFHGWYPVHAHNGFLDLVLELGIVGLLIVLLPLGMYGRRMYAWGMARQSPLCLWPLAYLLFLVLSNLAESALVRQNSMYWALYVAVVLSVQVSGSSGPHVEHEHGAHGAHDQDAGHRP